MKKQKTAEIQYFNNSLFVLSRFDTTTKGIRICDPMFRFDPGFEPTKIGEALLEALDKTVTRDRDPNVDHEKRFKKFVGIRTYRDYYKTVINMDVYLEANHVNINPLVPYQRVLQCIMEQIRCCALEPEQLGRLVCRQFGHCRNKAGDRVYFYDASRNQPGIESLISKLDRAGLFAYCKGGEKEKSIEFIMGTGFLYMDLMKRCFHVGERLVLASICREEILDYFRTVTHRKPKVEMDYSQDFTLLFDDMSYQILSSKEEKKKRFELINPRMIAAMNAILKREGLTDRAYQLFEDEKTCIVFLTPEMFDIIRGSNAIPDNEKPKEAGRSIDEEKRCSFLDWFRRAKSGERV